MNETENLIKILQDDTIFETPNRTFEIIAVISTYFQWKKDNIFILKDKNNEITLCI